MIPHPGKCLQDFPPSFQTNARVGLPQFRIRSLPSTFTPVHHSVSTMPLNKPQIRKIQLIKRLPLIIKGQISIPAFTWRDYETPRIFTENLTLDLPNKKHKFRYIYILATSFSLPSETLRKAENAGKEDDNDLLQSTSESDVFEEKMQRLEGFPLSTPAFPCQLSFHYCPTLILHLSVTDCNCLHR